MIAIVVKWVQQITHCPLCHTRTQMTVKVYWHSIYCFLCCHIHTCRSSVWMICANVCVSEWVHYSDCGNECGSEWVIVWVSEWVIGWMMYGVGWWLSEWVTGLLYFQFEREVEDTSTTASSCSVLWRGHSWEGVRGEREGDQPAAAHHGHHDLLGSAAHTLSWAHPADICTPLSPMWWDKWSGEFLWLIDGGVCFGNDEMTHLCYCWVKI